MSSSKKIVLVTPLKDEMENIDRLIESIAVQDSPIYAWIIVENGSRDGSKEYLDKVTNVSNVEHFIVINFSLPVEKYELGFKYSTVVNEGFKKVSALIKDKVLDIPEYIGICDADCFPERTYYQNLTCFMESEGVGISSGVGTFENGSHDGEAYDWVRGNCRLWRYDVFQDSGYIIGPSADALSLAKATIRGHKATPNHKIHYICREMGGRTRYEYYGYANYYRGITVSYAILKFFNYLRVRQFKQGIGFLNGYMISLFSRKEKIDDQELYQYFRKHLLNKIKMYFS